MVSTNIRQPLARQPRRIRSVVRHGTGKAMTWQANSAWFRTGWNAALGTVYGALAAPGTRIFDAGFLNSHSFFRVGMIQLCSKDKIFEPQCATSVLSKSWKEEVIVPWLDVVTAMSCRVFRLFRRCRSHMLGQMYYQICCLPSSFGCLGVWNHAFSPLFQCVGLDAMNIMNIWQWAERISKFPTQVTTQRHWRLQGPHDDRFFFILFPSTHQ